MPTIAQLLARTACPAGRVTLYGASGASITVDYRAHQGTPAHLADILLDWDLTDEAGVKIPPIPTGLETVDDDLQAYILSAILAHARASRRTEGSA